MSSGVAFILIFATRGDSALAGARFLILTTRLIPPMDGDYTMDHTVLIYLMHRDGKFVASESLAAPGVNQTRLIEGRPDRNRSWRFLFDHENGRESDLKRLAILLFRH